MEQGQASPRGWILIDDIRATLQGYEPHTVAEEGLVLGSPNAACPDQRPPVPSRSPPRAGRQESFKLYAVWVTCSASFGNMLRSLRVTGRRATLSAPVQSRHKGR